MHRQRSFKSKFFIGLLSGSWSKKFNITFLYSSTFFSPLRSLKHIRRVAFETPDFELVKSCFLFELLINFILIKENQVRNCKTSNCKVLYTFRMRAEEKHFTKNNKKIPLCQSLNQFKKKILT